jgi:hypothetical protein
MAPDRLIGGMVLVDPPGEPTAIAVAGFKVSLRSGDRRIADATTDGYGSYLFRNPPKGSYQLCWDGPAWKPACREEAVVIADQSVYIQPTFVDPSGMFVFGRLVGGAAARLEAKATSASAGSAVANVFGQYVLSGLPPEEITLTVSAGRATSTRRVMPTASGAPMDWVLAPQQISAPPEPAPTPICPKLNFFFNCPRGTPGGCADPALALGAC